MNSNGRHLWADAMQQLPELNPNPRYTLGKYDRVTVIREGGGNNSTFVLAKTRQGFEGAIEIRISKTGRDNLVFETAE